MVVVMAKVADKHPQTDFAGLQNSVQQERALMQRNTPDIGKAF